ncbi:MAG: asparagine synthase (glutamine-hydrolyzing) [Ramlibacter sp.]
MCGFAGFLTFERVPMSAVERHRTLMAMGNAIGHRGPDDAQYYDDGTLALVYRRLSIIDIEGGRQPFFSENGQHLLVANGEIYNHAALRSGLQAGHRFASRSDCEVLLHGFEQWGESCLDRAQGMFAMALWDLGERKLTLARDRLGIKPLYVCRLPMGILFGSELKALLAHLACPRTLAWRDIERSITSRDPSSSYVDGVELLPGGELMTVDARARVTQRRYWRLADHLGTAPYGEDAQRYSSEYARLLEDVTLGHLQRDVGAGIHLSGGLDSSLIAAIVARHDRDIPCFTAVERASYLGGDAEAAGRLTSRLSLPWVPVRFDYRSVVDEMALGLERLEEAVWMMDSPRLDLEWIFKDELHRVARLRHPPLKVMLLGQGADEFAGGYSRREDAMRGRWSDYLREEVEPSLALEDLRDGHIADGLQELRPGPGERGGLAPYHRMMLLLARQLQNHNLWHEDRTSSWNSLEARVPFLDHRLVELLASVPSSLHERLFWDKRIVRDALQRFVPGHVLVQPKIGFLNGRDTTSMDVTLHNLLRKVAPAFRDKYLNDRNGPFDPRKVEPLIEESLSRGPKSGAATGKLLQCIAVSIFERQLREPHAAARSGAAARPVLPIMQVRDWHAWASEMSAPAKCVRPWQAGERVSLRKGIEILVPRGNDGRRFCFFRDGAAAGEISLSQPAHWVSGFLKNLGTAPTRDFTVQDWLDEFDIRMSEFADIANILFHQGVVFAENAAEVVAHAGIAAANSDASPLPTSVWESPPRPHLIRAAR